VPAGEGFFETVLDLPPWHGLWNLVSSQWGQQATGAATIETETLPNGNTAVAAETYENVVPGGWRSRPIPSAEMAIGSSVQRALCRDVDSRPHLWAPPGGRRHHAKDVGVIRRWTGRSR